MGECEESIFPTGKPCCAVGRYGVEPGRFVPLNEEELARPPGTVDAYLIDEIGRLSATARSSSGR
jgi:hypothetical protein